MVMSLQAVMSSEAFLKTANLKLGYYTTTGLVYEKRIVIECSSPGREENIQYTYGNGLK